MCFIFSRKNPGCLYSLTWNKFRTLSKTMIISRMINHETRWQGFWAETVTWNGDLYKKSIIVTVWITFPPGFRSKSFASFWDPVWDFLSKILFTECRNFCTFNLHSQMRKIHIYTLRHLSVYEWIIVMLYTIFHFSYSIKPTKEIQLVCDQTQQCV